MQRPAVLLLAFNRPEPLRAVIDALRSSAPPRMYVAADGPRDPGRFPHDAAGCARVRELLTNLPWPCEMKTRFLDSNQGCAQAVSGAITWFFNQEPEGIILEDDCVPGPSFMPFCEAMLARYRDDQQVMSVLGTRCAPPLPDGGPSYGFSHYFNVWGWAGWRRSWDHYRLDIRSWRTWNEGGDRLFPHLPARSARAWARRFDAVARQAVPGTWDHQWTLAHMMRAGRCVLPGRNLVSNIGSGLDATHVTRDSPWCHRLTGCMPEPLIHPATTRTDAEADHHYETWASNHRSWPLRKTWQWINRWRVGSARFRRGGID